MYKMYNQFCKTGNFSEEIEQSKHQYAIGASEILRTIKTAMVLAPRDIWKCDPKEHELGQLIKIPNFFIINPNKIKLKVEYIYFIDILEKTYTSLNQLFQGYIVNEVDMNLQGTCKENCGYYSYSKVYGCYQNQFCARQRSCNGKLINCQYIDSDMWICPSVS